MLQLPSGTVTFLFTDIEGSTKLWERHPQAMQRALARHDAILRGAIVAHQGHVFKTVGDAFCAVFPSAVAGLQAALAAQHGLAAEPWGETGPLRVRMALHTGEPELRDGDYFGQPLNRVARLLAAGHGGQILLSDATQREVLPKLPEGVALRDLGKHRLKDLGRRESIAQCLAPRLPSVFPKLRTPPSPIPGGIAALGGAFLGLNAFAVGTEQATLGAALLHPASMRNSLTALVVTLSTQREQTLLVLAGLLFAATLIAVALWWHGGRIRAGTLGSATRIAGRHVGLRTVAFLLVATLSVLAAYAYQQYLWMVKLPIADGVTGLALTREASAASFREELAYAIRTEGPGREVVIRELPITFDATDVDEARALGRRIGAEAVLIYREDGENAEPGRYVAYIVFTDPGVSWVVGQAGNVASGTDAVAQPAATMLEPKPGVAVPTLRAASVEAVFAELVNAAAGIIAYEGNRFRPAIVHLERAAATGPESPNAGIVNFYLGNAYRFADDPVPAAAAYDRAISFYEGRRQAAEELGAQDALVLVQAYTLRGWLATYGDDWQAAVTWYEKGLGYREELLARAGGLERPSDVHAAYARLFAHLADAYRHLDKTEEQAYWEQRAAAELDAHAALASPDDPLTLAREGSTRFFLGDCAGAARAYGRVLILDPTDADAANELGIVAQAQGRPDLAITHWERALVLRPNDPVTLQNLAAVTFLRGNSSEAFYELTYLEQSEAYSRRILASDPANVAAYEAIADSAEMRARMSLLDGTALMTGDEVTVAKSQALWPADRERRQAALDAMQVVIEARRVVAAELRPDQAAAEAALAGAYAERAGMVYRSLNPLYGYPVRDPSDPRLGADGEQLLADVGQVREWTARVLATDSSATRLALLEAWAARVDALETEWSWYYFYTLDSAKQGALAAELRRAITDAIALIEAEAVTHPDEVEFVRTVYSTAWLFAMFDGKEDEAAAYDAKIEELTTWEQAQWEKMSSDDVHCREERERAAGDSARAAGDLQGALARYEAALAANPEHVPALIGHSGVHLELGDLHAALDAATTAAELAPQEPAAWRAVALAHLATGERAEVEAAYARHVELTAGLPPQERMAQLRLAIADLRDLLSRTPDRAALVRAAIPTFARALDGLPPAFKETFQCPQLYAALGALALDADDAAAAEPLFRTALALDPRQPEARTQLALAIIAQGSPATKEIAAAIQETRDPLWQQTVVGPADLLADMATAVQAYTRRFPTRQADVEPLVQAIVDEQQRLDVAGDMRRADAMLTG